MSAAEGEPQAKRAKPGPPPSPAARPTSPVAQALELFLNKLRTEGSAWRSKGEVELEVRLGMLVFPRLPDGIRARASAHRPGASPIIVSAEQREKFKITFVPGVSRDDYKEFESRLKSKNFQSVLQRTTAYNMPSGERIVQGTDGSFAKEQKQKIPVNASGPENMRHCIDIMLPGCSYDIRIAAVCEVPLPYQGGAPEGYEQRRVKHRHSWTDARLSWQADFTLVNVHDGNGTLSEALCEIELELKQPMTTAIIEGIEQKGVAGNDLATLLFHEEVGLVPSAKESSMNAVVVDDPVVVNEAAGICRRLAGDPNKGFPGASPVAFRRKHIEMVQKAQYMVSEKTDGVRYLMVVVSSGRAVLVDRKLNCFTMDGLDELRNTAELPAGTVLDGEIVQNRKFWRGIFVAFDILTYGDQHAMRLPFAKRLDLLNSNVMNTYDNKTKALQNALQLPLVVKKWYSKEHVSHIMKKIVEHNGHHMYTSPHPHNLYHHRTDGIIFCPGREYRAGTDFDLLKYKQSSMMTIDFLCSLESWPSVWVGFQAEEQAYVDFSQQVDFGTQDMLRLVADMKGQTQAIAEFCLNGETGLWKYQFVRPDKAIPNFSATVLDTMSGIADSLSIDELEYRVRCKGPDEDKYEQVHRDHMKKLQSLLSHIR